MIEGAQGDPQKLLDSLLAALAAGAGADTLDPFLNAIAAKVVDRLREGQMTFQPLAQVPFSQAAAAHLESRQNSVSAGTLRLETERLRPLSRFFADRLLAAITALDIRAYQAARLADGVSGRTVNLEVGVLRKILRKAGAWESCRQAGVQMLPEPLSAGRVLTPRKRRASSGSPAAARGG